MLKQKSKTYQHLKRRQRLRNAITFLALLAVFVLLYLIEKVWA